MNAVTPSKKSALAGRHIRLAALAAIALLILLGVHLGRMARDGAYAFLYGYPLVIMDVTREVAGAVRGPENALNHVRAFPDASFREVVRANVDTLYSFAFIDMKRGPWVFEVPAGSERYQVFPFMDAWTNVYASVGTRTEGAAGGRFLLAGPAWQGPVPEGMRLLRSPTSMVWLIGRTQTNGTADYPVVHTLQNRLQLQTLADWQAGSPSPMPAWTAAGTKPRPPVEQLETMDTQSFFTRLAALMVDNPPAAADSPMIATLARLGVQVGQPVAWGPLQAFTIDLGRRMAQSRLVDAIKKPRETVAGWAQPPAHVGDYGTDYALRAGVAMVGLGANQPVDAVYPSTTVDEAGQPLNGAQRYVLHFPKEALPPVRAFWSVTAYGEDHFFIDNPLKRHALGDRDPLRYNADGSLDLYLQNDSPGADKEANWLPVAANAPFNLSARLYWPQDAVLKRTWSMPGVVRK